jgi:hypothetical protein
MCCAGSLHEGLWVGPSGCGIFCVEVVAVVGRLGWPRGRPKVAGNNGGWTSDKRVLSRTLSLGPRASNARRNVQRIGGSQAKLHK